jgi:2-phosphosulfolactate phosphatase
VSGPQSRYAVRCEWAAQGLYSPLPECDVVIVVDVLSFSTAVDVAVSRGARIYPYPWKDGTAEEFALRERAAVARAAAERGATFGVVPAGERWADGSLRPSLEDLLGAGAVMSHLPGTRSPEAELAVRAFQAHAHDLRDAIFGCVSGQELRARGRADDLLIAAALDVSQTAPRLVGGAFDLSDRAL